MTPFFYHCLFQIAALRKTAWSTLQVVYFPSTAQYWNLHHTEKQLLQKFINVWLRVIS